MLRLDHVIKSWKESGALNSQINLYGFWKPTGSKKVHLNVDSLSYWMATNNAKDNLLKQEYFERYGIAEGLRRLAKQYPFSPSRKPTNSTRPETSTATVPGVSA